MFTPPSRFLRRSFRRGPFSSTLCDRAGCATGFLLAFATCAAAQPATFIRSDYGSASGARAIVSADFNRDGAPDLAQANNGRNTVTVLLNNHEGGFVRGFETPVGLGPFAMATGDFNGDAIPDLAVANADGHSISVLLYGCSSRRPPTRPVHRFTNWAPPAGSRSISKSAPAAVSPAGAGKTTGGAR